MTGNDPTTDTIVALASAAGRAGVSVVRISGAQAIPSLEALTREPPPEPRKLGLRALYCPSDDNKTDMLDEALVATMPGPNSFTGEDVVELHLHGGPAIVDAVLDACLSLDGMRLAEPGEFTRRAFENERLDLTRAESIVDLIDAETDAQRRQAFRQYGGALEKTYEDWRELLIAALASQEAAIDFPDEDDIPTGVETVAHELIVKVAQDIGRALEGAHAGRAIREGYKVAIIGAPNAGKSTLLNALAGRDAAIVSDIAGTTRDVLEVRLVIGGYVVWLVDTAGLRETSDVIEAEGVRRALERAEDADLRILVAPASDKPVSMDHVHAGDILVINKCDLNEPDTSVLNQAKTSGVQVVQAMANQPGGTTDLEALLQDRVVSELSSAPTTLVTRKRHVDRLTLALDHLERARSSLESDLGAEYVSEDLRLATRALGELTGRVDVEDLLDKIFSDFCIGK